MSNRHHFFPLSAALSALALLALSAPSVAGPWRAHGDRFLPSQSISYDLGSKLMSGYFLRQDENCSLTMMIAENGDDDAPLQLSAARVQLALSPMQAVGFDSEDGQSITLTCGASGAQMTAERAEPETRRYRRVTVLRSSDIGTR